jgi:adenosylcobinamide kinase/adenosylcobinamide-phosphate guanylyltransferase
MADATDALKAVVEAARGPLVLVSNEVGQGIVPDTPLGRTFRDAQGRLNQEMASLCDRVVLVAAGCPVLLKPAPALDMRLA